MSPSKTTVTMYIGNSIFHLDSLQFINTSEGRIRVNSAGNGFVFDYFLKDHLGSTRMVVTDDYTVASPILEATSYYPFGLTMSGINFKASNTLDNKYEYNGKEKQSEEFSDGSGLELYDYGARMQDPQVGRFWTQDRFTEKYYSLNPYQYASNDPLYFVDNNGDSLNIADLVALAFKDDPTSKNPLGGDFTSDLQQTTGLTLITDENGNVSYKIDTNTGKAIVNPKGTSSKARETLISIIDSKSTLTVLNNFGGQKDGFAGSHVKISDKSKIYIDAFQVGLIQSFTSPDLNKNSVGLSFDFFHEYGHTEMGGSFSDPAIGHDISPTDALTNQIRSELGSDYGQRESYLPYSIETSKFIPFDSQAKQDLENGKIPTTKYLKIQNP